VNRFLRVLSTWTQLFFASYALLFALLAIKFEDEHLEILCGSMALFGLMCSARILGVLVDRATNEISISKIDDQGGEVGAYILTYMLPFLTIASPTWRETLTYALFIVVVAIIYIRSNLIFINPVLYIFGYRIFGITTADDQSGFLVAKRMPPLGDIDVVILMESVYVVF
jgi:hypothetical protein